MRLTQKKRYAYEAVYKIFSVSSTRTNLLIWRYVNKQILLSGSTWMYITETLIYRGLTKTCNFQNWEEQLKFFWAVQTQRKKSYFKALILKRNLRYFFMKNLQEFGFQWLWDYIPHSCFRFVFLGSFEKATNASVSSTAYKRMEH